MDLFNFNPVIEIGKGIDKHTHIYMYINERWQFKMYNMHGMETDKGSAPRTRKRRKNKPSEKAHEC